MTQPDIRYARDGDVHVAYQVTGNGPVDLVFVPGFVTNLDVRWEDAGFGHLLGRLSRFSRLITFDKRGTGLSDGIDGRHPPSLDIQVADVRAVMDAAGSGRAVLLGEGDGGPIAMLFAATYPERTRALVLYGSYAHVSQAMSAERSEKFVAGIDGGWGSGATAAALAPERVNDARFRAWWSRWERQSASSAAAAMLARATAAIDVRPILPKVRASTLVLHRRDDAYVKVAAGRYLADKIPSARLVELPGRDHPIFVGDVDPLLDEIEQFLTGERAALERVLATVLLARLIAPAKLAARLGDLRWNERLARLREIAGSTVQRFRGRFVLCGPEEIVAHFDAPARALRCAVALRSAARDLDIELAQGIHAGEIEVAGDAIAGLALHVAGRISERAKANDILASGVVTELVAGSGLHFTPHSDAAIEGLQHPLRLYAVVTEQHLEPATKHAGAPDLDALSLREREVLNLIAEGLSNATMSERLRLSEHTVKRHVANILLKLNLPTRAAAAALIGRQRPGRGL